MAELSTVARPYAKAAFEYAFSQGQLAEWSNMLSLAATAVSDKAVQNVLSNPGISQQQKAEVVLDICAAVMNENGKNFVQTLSEVGRLSLFPQIAAQFEVLKAEQEKTVEVEIFSAYELTNEQQTKLAQALQKRLNREIKIQTQVDKSLIGGVLIHAGDTVIDGSVRGKLAKLAEAMNS
ncbi:F-type H+-transporting ATPase subunit delta [Oceanospirillum multiglobuliferum]|uniref:ATP synthase subunit delta n=1 Tax=Oceanospirillum multiglobuliferum TaxID=64969 RepID=A0A1T4NSZ5_9GAMM|nr:F0F1 ATP synthase subunit delta [Oceanospirillum multiglobuliferum]OPX55679.1 F0F1 ATP synthase subunit delta [Oceanospirillum multiglobuliferum]SJZ82255.1 F-type H+-transporting ATPase subunit delta [Oceanospirillum multiglobuliferum]